MISQRERGEVARFYTVTDPKKHQRGFTLYKVTARIISRKNPEAIQEITVWKRYSDFKKLHKDLWQIHRNLYRQTDLFPPFARAKIFGRFDEAVIEERRQCAEDLLQFSANIPALYASQYIQDFFKDGEVQDGSELIGPAEPFSDFLADSQSDSSSEVHKSIEGGEESNLTSQSEYGGPSSDSDLTSLLRDGDSLTDVEDGMASGCSSPNLWAESTKRPSSPSKTEVEPEWATGAALPSTSLQKADYLQNASQQINLALQRELQQDYTTALCYYRNGVDLLLQGVQGEVSPSRREAVKKKTAEYLLRAEFIASTHLSDTMGQNSTQNRALAAQCCKGSWGQQTQSDELHHYRVLGVIDKVLLVMDKRTQEMFVLKGLRKSSECARVKKTVVPCMVPHMVRLRKSIVLDDSIFLLLHYAEGGKLWSHVSKFLHRDSPDESFDIPFIQKSHKSAVHCEEALYSSESSGSRPSLELQEHQEAVQPQSTQSSVAGLGEHARLDPPHDSENTSEEEECTSSYLTLCHEYELEKVESDILGEVMGATETEDNSCELEGEGSAAEAFPRSYRDSMISSDSLCSPTAPFEMRFFADGGVDEDLTAASTLDSLDQSKRSPMELFRIDSKDSADICRPLISPSNQDSEVTEVTEDPLEIGEVVEVRGHLSDLWCFDSDQGSNESVPVISFKDAMVEDPNQCCIDEGQPPDLLVNLPGVGGVTAVMEEDLTEELAAAGAAFAVEAKPLPQFGKPDVLQLGEEAGLDLPVNEDGSSHFVNQSNASKQEEHVLSMTISNPLDSNSLKNEADLAPTLEPATKERKSVSEIFRELDKLAEVASHTRLPETLVRSWAVDILLALDSLHQEGIICRDLNPNNILLDHRGHVELTYFCSWTEVEESCDPAAVTKMYCAPEVGGILDETAACDWWSLGALLFELLTGKTLQQCHPAGISRHTSLNTPEFLSEEARSLLEQLLQYNPVERLGAGVGGVEDIKSHPFFAQVNWPK